MLSPLISTHSLQHSTYAVRGVQNIMTHLAYDHINSSFFILSYMNTKIIGSMQGHTETYPQTQLVKTSHSSVAAHSSFVINVFSKLFSSHISALHPMPRTSSSCYNTHTTLPTKVIAQCRTLLFYLQPMVWKPEPCCITLCL